MASAFSSHPELFQTFIKLLKLEIPCSSEVPSPQMLALNQVNTEKPLYLDTLGQIEECPHFRMAEVPLYNRGVPRFNRGVPLYTEVSSFQGVGIEEFHCIKRCPHFRELVLLYM